MARGDVIVGAARAAAGGAPRRARRARPLPRGAAPPAPRRTARPRRAGAPRRRSPAPTYRVDVALTWATPDARPDGGARVGVHHGTRESAARLVELGGRFFQLRLEEPIVPAAGDRLVIRSLAPPDTLGGGVDARPDAAPPRAESATSSPASPGSNAASPNPRPPPERPAPTPQRAPLGPRALELEAAPAAKRATSRRSTTPTPSSLAALREHGRIVRLGPTMHVHTDALDEVHDLLVAAIERDGEITLAGLRDELQHLTQVRAGLPRALRRREGHAAPRRRAGAAPPALNAALPERHLVRARGLERRLHPVTASTSSTTDARPRRQLPNSADAYMSIHSR